MTLIYLNCENTFDSTDVRASIYDRNNAARHFDTTHEIKRSLSLVKSLFKGRNAPIWRQRDQTHLRLSGTDWLKRKLILYLIIVPVFAIIIGAKNWNYQILAQWKRSVSCFTRRAGFILNHDPKSNFLLDYRTLRTCYCGWNITIRIILLSFVLVILIEMSNKFSCGIWTWCL